MSRPERFERDDERGGREVVPPATRSGTRAWWAAGLIVLIVAGVWAWLAHRAAEREASGAAARAAAHAVPVVAVSAERGDMPIALNGLGSVTAFNTVTVRSRVDGELVKVAFQEGQFVRQGDRLAEIDPRPYEAQLTQAEGQLGRDTAQLTSARINLERYRDLLAKGFVSKQQTDDQASLVGQFEGAVKVDQGAIANAKLQIAYSKIDAPISGRIGLRLVDVGNIVHATDTSGLLVITQVEPIAVLFTIPEDELQPVLKKLAAGQHLDVEAYDRSGRSHIATGQLLTVDNQIDPTTGTSKLKAVFPNGDHALFPNQFVNVRLLLDVHRDATIVPSAAIQRGPQGAYVYVIRPDQTAEVRAVTVGVSDGGRASIDSGLSAGEIAVIDGADKLRAGTKVEIQKPGGAPAAASPKPA